MELNEKTALVTGGGKGIGRAIAEILAANGAQVVVTGRNLDHLNEVAKAIGGVAIQMDQSDRDSTDQSIQAIRTAVGTIDILVNNAGIATAAPLNRIEDQTWDRIMEINATSVFRLTRAFLPDMTNAGWGRIVNIASNAGLTGYGYSSAYCASKHALVGFTRALAIDIAKTGVTINSICPGWVETDMANAAVERIAKSTRRDPGQARQALEQMSPQNRMITVGEVAHTALMLCREESRGIHGQSIVIDGGALLK